MTNENEMPMEIWARQEHGTPNHWATGSMGKMFGYHKYIRADLVSKPEDKETLTDDRIKAALDQMPKGFYEEIKCYKWMMRHEDIVRQALQERQSLLDCIRDLDHALQGYKQDYYESVGLSCGYCDTEIKHAEIIKKARREK